MDRMKLTHLFEKFMVAVEVLATSSAPLQKRLEGAYRSFMDVEPTDFDDKEMQGTFEQIRSRLMKVQHGQIDSIAATCKQNVRSGGRGNSRFYLQPLSKNFGEASLMLLTRGGDPQSSLLVDR